MPGKYSHSAVLAQYSSRGLIDLPNDQQIAYLKSASYARTTPSQASSTPWSRDPPDHPTQNRRVVHVSQPLPTDTETLPSESNKVIRDLSQKASAQTSGHAPTRHKPSPPSSASETQTQLPATQHDISRRIVDHSRTESPVQASHQSPPKKSMDILDYAKVSQHALKERYYRDTPLAVQQRSRSIEPRKASQGSPPPKPNAPARVSAMGATPRSVSLPPKAHTTAPAWKQKHLLPVVGQDLQRQDSNGTLNTQIYNPVMVSAEPDFDGFSDNDDALSSYFHSEYHMPRSGSAPRSLRSTTPLEQAMRQLQTSPGPPPVSSVSRLSKRTGNHSQQSHSRTISSSAISDGRPPATPDDLTARLDSLTSVSSNGEWGLPIQKIDSSQRARKASVDSQELRPQSARDAPSVDKLSQHASNRSVTRRFESSWRLPEIDEDDDLGFDLFGRSATNHAHTSRLRSVLDDWPEQPLGTISSGRDVDFQRDAETESLASAACPPDIGRHREEEVTSLPLMLQALAPDRVDSRSTSHTGTPSKDKKAVSFFARLRSRSRARN